jgi:hypothetical protein
VCSAVLRFGDKDVENVAGWCEDRESSELASSGELPAQASSAAVAAVVQPAPVLNMYVPMLKQ